MAPPPTKKSHTRRNVGIAVIVVVIGIIALIVIGAASSSITITSVNAQIDYPNGATSGFLGSDSQIFSSSTFTLSSGGQFTETFTLSNSASIFTSHTIVSITTSTPGFTVNSISPNMPYTLGPGASVRVTAALTAPSAYDGSLLFIITVE